MGNKVSVNGAVAITREKEMIKAGVSTVSVVNYDFSVTPQAFKWNELLHIQNLFPYTFFHPLYFRLDFFISKICFPIRFSILCTFV